MTNRIITDKYILDGHTPVPCHDVLKWAEFFDRGNRIVARTQVTPEVLVSTVFLGLDHSFDGPVPILFETMIFGGEHDQYQERYATWEEAEKGHAEAIELAKKTASYRGFIQKEA